MSTRSFRRANQRRVEAERRRRRLRARRGALVAGAAVGAFALVAPVAQAANIEVNSLGDSHAADGCDVEPAGDCTLRDALAVANANSEPDTITFQSGLSGTLRLQQGQLYTTSTTTADEVMIQGPGAGVITISGDKDSSGTPTVGDSRIFNVQSASSGNPSLTISGLTLSGGYPNGPGAAVYLSSDTSLNVSNATITGNKAGGGSGGAIATPFLSYASVSVSNSTISNNTASGGGGAIIGFGPLTIDHSTLSGNHATTGSGGAVAFGSKYGPLQITDSTISGNTASGSGGGLSVTPATGPKYSPQNHQISDTTIAGNTAGSYGGGLNFGGLANMDGSLTITHSTISGNQGSGGSFGGGIQVGGTVNGDFETEDSSITGNYAGRGGGVSIHPTSPAVPEVGASGSISFDNSTVASNTADTTGGGFYLGVYGPSGGPYTTAASIPLSSTIAGDNADGTGNNDLDLADAATTGGFGLSFSLVEAPGDGIDTQASSITGQDPQLGGLADNGGPTQTKLPSATSPAIDAGSNPLSLGTDQRGDPRTVDLSPANAGDGTDIGAVERAAPTPPLVQPTTPTSPVTPATPKCKKHKKKRSAKAAKKKLRKCKKKKKRR